MTTSTKHDWADRAVRRLFDRMNGKDGLENATAAALRCAYVRGKRDTSAATSTMDEFRSLLNTIRRHGPLTIEAPGGMDEPCLLIGDGRPEGPLLLVAADTDEWVDGNLVVTSAPDSALRGAAEALAEMLRSGLESFAP
jgi:hypothetical protein